MVVNDPALIAAPETTKVYRAGSVIRKGPYPAAGRRTAHEDYSTVRQNRYGRAAHVVRKPPTSLLCRREQVLGEVDARSSRLIGAPIWRGDRVIRAPGCPGASGSGLLLLRCGPPSPQAAFLVRFLAGSFRRC